MLIKHHVLTCFALVCYNSYMLKFYNTKSRQIDEFKPINDNQVLLYTCGPTVYNYLHVGNWVAFIRWDILVRTLQASGYSVKRVMNITDVGHLVSDADEGEDKMEKGAKREGKTAWEVAKLYSDDFLDGMAKLSLIPPTYITKATGYIPQQIDLVKTLEAKGYTYTIDDGVYFDTSKFPTYANFAHLDLADQEAGARVEFNPQKRNKSDFALWKFTPAGEARDMEWWAPFVNPSDQSEEEHLPGTTHGDILHGAGEQQTDTYNKYVEGVAQPATKQNAPSNSSAASSASRQGVAVRGSWGFPGWHLECSAMAMDKLGDTIDIHTGGIDHIPVHHTNEIAQSEAATGQTFANYWVHNNFLLVDGTKVSKSLGNTYELKDLAAKGFSPQAYRMFVLQSHYRTESNFTWENLQSAKNRLANWQAIADLRWQTIGSTTDVTGETTDATVVLQRCEHDVLNALQDDMNTPEALKYIDEALSYVQKNGMQTNSLHAFNDLLNYINDVLGIDLLKPDISAEQKQLIAERQKARESKNWAKSDELRDELAKQSLEIKDASNGTIWSRINK